MWTSPSQRCTAGDNFRDTTQIGIISRSYEEPFRGVNAGIAIWIDNAAKLHGSVEIAIIRGRRYLVNQ